MSVNIRHYQEGFEEDQAKIGKEFTKNWQLFQQSSAEGLKQVYSAEGFDPETRLYAFKDDEIVGFLPSRITDEGERGVKRGHMDFPFVKKGYDNAAQELLNRVFSVLKEKGVSVVEIRVGKHWGNTEKLAAEHGFEFARDAWVTSSGDVDDIDVSKLAEPNHIVNYDHERDSNDVSSMFKKIFGMTDAQIENNFKAIETAGDQVVARCVYRETLSART